MSAITTSHVDAVRLFVGMDAAARNDFITALDVRLDTSRAITTDETVTDLGVFRAATVVLTDGLDLRAACLAAVPNRAVKVTVDPLVTLASRIANLRFAADLLEYGVLAADGSLVVSDGVPLPLPTDGSRSFAAAAALAAGKTARTPKSGGSVSDGPAAPSRPTSDTITLAFSGVPSGTVLKVNEIQKLGTIVAAAATDTTPAVEGYVKSTGAISAWLQSASRNPSVDGVTVVLDATGKRAARKN